MINNMDFRQIQEMQKINRLKENNECLVCEIVIPKELKQSPASILHGTTGDIEMALMIQYLEGTIESIKQNFPEVKQILPLLKKHGSVKEAYKSIETNRGD